jgi:hypothetical protein
LSTSATVWLTEGQGLFAPDGGDPFLDRRLISFLQAIERRDVVLAFHCRPSAHPF